MNRQIIEWAPFRLRADATEARVLEASARLQRDFLEAQPGFVRRELLRGGDGQFVDIVWWTSRQAAEAAMAAAASSAACGQYFALMHEADHAEPGAGVVHFESLAQYEGT